ncbi:unnamed protein product [Owenia fusiformis]|uniref:Mitochondria-eating protein n=1 Tax=Owenia fusiformis TaxID=6347 RepID=A0A8J1THJ9_OWEFU|nr:unnamed protein product [Owenia fusiformis]
MAESLRRLVNIGSFTSLQEKLERWLDDYHVLTCDQNVARGCEIIELNSRLQGQLFKLLSITASEGGLYGGASTIKARLLPLLGANFFTGTATADTTLSLLSENAAKDRELNDLEDTYERSLVTLEDDLKATQLENDDLKNELADTQDELDKSQRMSTSEKMFTEQEIRDLRAKFNDSQNEVMRLRLQLSESDATIRRLRDDVIISTGRVPYITTSDVNDSLASYRYLPRVSSPLHSDDTTQRVRQQSLISRFNDMFSQDRLDAMDILRRYSDDHENNQRIVFVAMQEAFSVAKLAFRQFKIKVRSQLAGTHLGPDTLEEAVQDYINRNTDLYDLPALVSDVIRALNRNPKLYLQPTASYTVIQTFIREACKLAWQMSALAHPLDIAIATDAELFDEFKYRRSYDSEYTAPLVNHHIWPCLQQSTKVLMKGEANTRRGASLGSPRRSRSPTRSMSPVRSYSPTRSVSPSRRSPSPRRTLSSLGDSFSGRSSPSGMRSLSRSSLRSSSPSRLY